MPQDIIIIRQPNGPSYFTSQPTLDGTTYTLVFLWNERDSIAPGSAGAWYMTVWDAAQTTVLQADAKLVVNSKINALLADRSPPGAFLLVDTANDPSRGAECGFDDIGNRCVLQYVTQAELPAPEEL